ncbi:MAG: globin-coupled sensor protein [Candidatus Binatia bacterium]
MSEQHPRLLETCGLTDENLAYRRDFIRLGDHERAILVNLIPWAESVSADVAREFYDWQFSFPRTREFFERQARAKGISLDALRAALERSQKGYFETVFTGARNGYDRDYFAHRLLVGWIHDHINLPFKWFIGSYSEYQRLTSKYLHRDFGSESTSGFAARLHKRAAAKLDVAEAEQAIFRVFNLDMQAIGDSFLLNTLESMGLSVTSVQTTAASDRTEHLDQVKETLATILQQAEAIGQHRIHSTVLDAVVPGKLGEAFGSTVANLRQFGEQLVENATALEAVAAAAEEMITSIQEISRNSNDTARVANAAATEADASAASVDHLASSSNQIGQVLKVIANIAAQTNLLALNATIEAARAGEAGKGFAVVASEVKELAKETARATEDIATRIHAVQSDTQGAVQSMSRIGSTIAEITEFTNSIAAAIEEQQVVAKEITRNVSEAAHGTSAIAGRIAGHA